MPHLGLQSVLQHEERKQCAVMTSLRVHFAPHHSPSVSLALTTNELFHDSTLCPKMSDLMTTSCRLEHKHSLLLIKATANMGSVSNTNTCQPWRPSDLGLEKQHSLCSNKGLRKSRCPKTHTHTKT